MRNHIWVRGEWERRASDAVPYLDFPFRAFTERRNVSLFRLCQPGPDARKCPSTSASSRSDTNSFGLTERGLPRRTTALSIFARHSGDDKSGASSLQSGGVKSLLSFIRLPQADDPSRIWSGRPDNHDKTTIHFSDGDKSLLAIIHPVIRVRRSPRPHARNPTPAPPASWLAFLDRM